MKHMALMPIKQVKANNIKKTLTCLLSSGSATKMDLVTNTGLSNSTLSDCINNLCKLNIVKTTGFDESIGGRRPSIYSINTQYATFIGITINKSNIEVCVVDFCGNSLESYNVDILQQTPVITVLYDAIEQMKTKFKDQNILSLGISTTGIVDYTRGIILSSDELNWHNVHLKELVERKFFIPTYIDHKINNATLFESLLGTWRNTENFAFVSEDCLEKFGVYLNGHILRGEENLVGNVLDVNIDNNLLLGVKRFLSLKTVIIGYTDDNSTLKNNELFNSVKLSDNYFAVSAAVASIINWYETIYFILN